MRIKVTSQKGISLLEVMVSLIILSLGLLGYAGLQAVTIKNSHNAYLRTQATSLAYNALDRMRANRVELNGYEMDFGGTPSAADAKVWVTELKSTLPDGDAKIDRDSGTGQVTVTVRWYDSSTNAVSHEFSTGSRI